MKHHLHFLIIATINSLIQPTPLVVVSEVAAVAVAAVVEEAGLVTVGLAMDRSVRYVAAIIVVPRIATIGIMTLIHLRMHLKHPLAEDNFTLSSDFLLRITCLRLYQMLIIIMLHQMLIINMLLLHTLNILCLHLYLSCLFSSNLCYSCLGRMVQPLSSLSPVVVPWLW